MSNNQLLPAFIILISVIILSAAADKKMPADAPRRLELLFLGHKTNRHHNSERLADLMTKEYFKAGINITFTSEPDDLNEKNLSNYDGLILYANYDTIKTAQARALLDFVRSGKGFVPLHCASFCFRNSPAVVDMIGGQFKSHKYDSFPAVIVQPGHPVMLGIAPFVTTDETYVHDKFANEIEVLTERVEGDHHEPYTWVRPFGKGRVFYTAYGHDENTFNTPGFLDLVKSGIMWAVGDDAKKNLDALELAKPQYFDGPVPNYEKKIPAPQVQRSLTPEQSMSLIQVPVGFQLQLFAAEPEVVNPIYINWDERGRLWVIETVDYPNEVKDDDIGDDRIKILEDTNGDGKADKTTIFADKLNIPTSFVFTNGGIIVSQAPSFLFLKDTDGDDKADVRQEVLTGWGKRDTHAQASNLRYGPDNKIWGVVGYSGYYNGKKGRDSLKFDMGAYRFDPNTRELEFMSTTSNNTWGLGFSEDFDVFISTANNTHTAFFGMPKRYFDKAKINETGVEKTDAHYEMHVATKNLRQVDVHGGFTAAAGHSVYTARTFPKEYWNKVAFVTEPTGRLIHKVLLQQNGSGFKENGDGWNMLASADEWAAPIQAEVGPDGALWITDWYDFIIQHNPTPSVASAGLAAVNGKGNAYINPLRDHERGRIYRLVYKGNEQKNLVRLDKNDMNGLVNALSNDNMFWRITAQRLLVEKNDQSVLPDLYKLVQNEQVDEAGINAPALHALWTLHGLKALNGANQQALAVAFQALHHPAAGVRRAAIQVLPKTTATFRAMQKAKLFEDKDLRVRLAAVLATTDMKPSAEIGNVLVSMAGNEENIADNWIKQALTVASKVNEETFKTAFKKKGLNANPSLAEASLAQRLAFGARLKTIPFRRVFGKQQADVPNPDIANSELLLSGDIEKTNIPRVTTSGINNAPGVNTTSPQYNGVIVAHGNRTEGYGLYFMDDKMYFTVNQGGKSFRINTSEALPAKFSFRAALQKTGNMQLVIDGKIAGSAKAPGLFKNNLEPPLRAGADPGKGGDKIADYPDSIFTLSGGNLTRTKLETLEIIASTVASKEEIDKTIVVKVLKDAMKYDKQLLTAKAGTTIRIVFENPDFMQHNLVLVKPKTMEKVGLAADKLALDPNGVKLHYVPKIAEVLKATPLVNPGGKYILTIKLPDVAGDYPYVCTFPGHWRVMNGILRLTRPDQKPLVAK